MINSVRPRKYEEKVACSAQRSSLIRLVFLWMCDLWFYECEKGTESIRMDTLRNYESDQSCQGEEIEPGGMATTSEKMTGVAMETGRSKPKKKFPPDCCGDGRFVLIEGLGNKGS